MGAETTYCVTVKRLVTDYVRVSAVVASEAMEIAAAMPGVAMVVEAFPDGNLRDRQCDDEGTTGGSTE